MTTTEIAPPRDPEAEATREAAPSAAESASPELIEDELLVEEISIDGMCGVY